MAQKSVRVASKTISLALAFFAGYSVQAYQRRGWISPDNYWFDAGQQAGRYDLLKGQCEAARGAYLRERQGMLNVLRADAARYPTKVEDSDYLKIEIACKVE